MVVWDHWDLICCVQRVYIPVLGKSRFTFTSPGFTFTFTTAGDDDDNTDDKSSRSEKKNTNRGSNGFHTQFQRWTNLFVVYLWSLVSKVTQANKNRDTSIQSAGVVPEVNLRNSWHAGKKACKQGIHPGFETQGRRHQKSKTGVSVAPRKGLMSSKNFF